MFSFFEKLSNPFPENNLEKPPTKLIPFILYYCQGFKKYLFSIAIIGIVMSLLEVSLFSFLGEIVNWLSASSPQELFQKEWQTMLYMGAVVLIFLPFLNALSSIIRHQSILGNMPMAIRWRMHQYLLQQSMSFYQNEFSGRISARLMQSALAIRGVANSIVDVMIYAAVYFLSIITLLATQHYLVMLIMLLWLILYACLIIYFLPRLRSASESQSNARALMTGRITDAYTNISTVKLFAHSRREFNYAKQAMSDFLKTVYGQMRLVSCLDIALQTLNNLLIFSISACGIYLWSQDSITLGGVALASASTLRLNGMSHWIMWEISALFEHLGTVNDGMQMLSQPIMVLDKPEAKDLEVKRGEIDFQNVEFSYQEKAQKIVINNLNLKIKAGEKIGLIGKSGAGKSTLVNILLRFYDIERGKILIDGQDISQITQESLRQNIAMVTQDTSLLHRSVRENVLYGKPNASEEELLSALQKAEALDFTSNLVDPKGNTGLDAQVGERGVKLSGGQRQRIAIARVLLKNAPILILDEATSALDSEVEAAIQNSLIKLMEGKTVIAIAHRLSTIAAMDRLIVLDEGKIAEEGTHEELLKLGGIYAQLWQRQTGAYLGE